MLQCVLHGTFVMQCKTNRYSCFALRNFVIRFSLRGCGSGIKIQEDVKFGAETCRLKSEIWKREVLNKMSFLPCHFLGSALCVSWALQFLGYFLWSTKVSSYMLAWMRIDAGHIWEERGTNPIVTFWIDHCSLELLLVFCLIDPI